jgi:hypothetical protein
MGYRGKVKEQEQARALRARNRTLADIARTLGVSKSSVSLWVRDVPFTPTLRLRSPHRRPHPAHEAKLRQIEELNQAGKARIGRLSDEAFFVAGIALYAGEGAKADGLVKFANSDPEMVRFFCAWFAILLCRRITSASLRVPAPGARPRRRRSVLVRPRRDTEASIREALPGHTGSVYSPEQT